MILPLLKKKKNPFVIMTTFEEANSVKPEKFTGSHFQRWKKQMKYWLIALGFIYALEERNEKTLILLGTRTNRLSLS